jgi:hypothetical protein
MLKLWSGFSAGRKRVILLQSGDEISAKIKNTGRRMVMKTVFMGKRKNTGAVAAQNQPSKNKVNAQFAEVLGGRGF